MSTTIACDIVVLPELPIAEKAEALSRQLGAEHDTLFELGKGCTAHATLYMTQLRVDSLDHVKELLASIAAGTPQLLAETGSYMQVERYIDVNYQATPALASPTYAS